MPETARPSDSSHSLAALLPGGGSPTLPFLAQFAGTIMDLATFTVRTRANRRALGGSPFRSVQSDRALIRARAPRDWSCALMRRREARRVPLVQCCLVEDGLLDAQWSPRGGGLDNIRHVVQPPVAPILL